MRWTREAYLDLMTFGPCDRPMFCELFGPLIGLEEEWRAQGATQEELDLVAFDWDYVPVAGCGAACGPFNTPPGEVLEETETHRIARDHLGRVLKEENGGFSLPASSIRVKIWWETGSEEDGLVGR